MTQVPDSLRILAALRQLDESGFVRLLRARRVPTRGLTDPIDLAEWLCDDANVTSGLRRLHWRLLRGLRLGHEGALEAAARLQLAVRADHIELLPHARAELERLLPEVPTHTDALAHDAPSGSDRAQEGAQLALDALWQLDARRRAVQHARTGVRLSAIELRRLAVELERPVEVVSAVYAWLAHAELIGPAGEIWAPTASGREFSSRPIEQRWLTLAQAWLAELSLDEVREATWLRDPEHPAVALGLADAAHGSLTKLGALVLDGRADDARDLLAGELTPPVHGVYVQPDQTIIAPGPLSAADDAALRGVADLEHRALASQFRLTQASIERALLAGDTLAGIRGQLERLSLTGIPQPVAYLLESSAERFGRVRVRAHVDDLGRISSRVRAESPQLLDTLRIDTALSSLALRPADSELASAASPETTLLTLIEARYPAALEDLDGELRRGVDPVTAPVYRPDPSATLRAAAAALAEHTAGEPERDDEATWLRRRLELARRDRAELRLEIALGGDRTAQLELVPISVTEQRLRARDTEAEVERTVPLRAIVAVEGTRVAGRD